MIVVGVEALLQRDRASGRPVLYTTSTPEQFHSSVDQHLATIVQVVQAREKLPDAALCKAVEEMESGLIDAALGAFLYKKRVARPGGGKSGGYRIVLSVRIGERYVFLHGFSKNDKANITQDETWLETDGQTPRKIWLCPGSSPLFLVPSLLPRLAMHVTRDDSPAQPHRTTPPGQCARSGDTCAEASGYRANRG